MKWYLFVIYICNPLVINDTENFSHDWVFVYYLQRSVYSSSLPSFVFGLFVFLLLNHFLLKLLILSFAAYFLILMKSDLFIFPFVSLTFSVIRIHCQVKSHENLPCIFHCKFYAFSSSIWNINSFWVNFGMWCEIGVQFSLFCM